MILWDLLNMVLMAPRPLPQPLLSNFQEGPERDGASDHQPNNCLLNCLFWRRSKKTSNLCVTGLCEGNPPVNSEYPAQRASNTETVSIWWRHHDNKLLYNILQTTQQWQLWNSNHILNLQKTHVAFMGKLVGVFSVVNNLDRTQHNTDTTWSLRHLKSPATWL